MHGTEEYERTATLVEIGDLDGLNDRVDSLCFDGYWELVVDLRDRCRAALARGRQLWPSAAYAEYRLALDSPPQFAATVIDSPADRFTLGPFAEVLASTHSFRGLRPHLMASPSSGIIAHERVIRGELLDDFDDLDWLGPYADVLGTPLWLEEWEPQYPVAEYGPTKALFPMPSADCALTPGDGTVGGVVNDSDTIRALCDLAAVWCAESNGRAEAVAIEGSASDAVATLGCRSHRIGRVSSREALALMAWAAGSGGAHGRRRGMSSGRSAAWWALTNLAGLGDESDVRPEELGRAAEELEWSLWDDGSPATGWSLRLAIYDPAEKLAWAVNASDFRLD